MIDIKLVFTVQCDDCEDCFLGNYDNMKEAIDAALKAGWTIESTQWPYVLNAYCPKCGKRLD